MNIPSISARSVVWMLLFLGLLMCGAAVFLADTDLRTPQQESDTGMLTDEEYAEVRLELEKLTTEQDPRTALSRLRSFIAEDRTVLRSCHQLVHDIGHAAYKKYADFGNAMLFQDELCNSGYLHGVIESYFADAADIKTRMQEVCTPYTVGSFQSWECYHGIGHGVMFYSYNDVPKALELCDTFTDATAKGSCINGVFMENFNTDRTLHGSRFLDTEDPLQTCREQDVGYKRDCYLYVPTFYLSLHPNAYTEALTWCRGAEGGYVDSCIGGVGMQTMKEHIAEPTFVESVCEQIGEDLQDACIVGAVGLHINHHGSLAETRMACALLNEENGDTCRRVVAEREPLFE